jgi:hypothetical protein
MIAGTVAFDSEHVAAMVFVINNRQVQEKTSAAHLGVNRIALALQRR